MRHSAMIESPMRALALMWLIAITLPARADQTVLRIGTVVPEGTSWAREWQAFANAVDHATAGTVRIKTFFGGVTGDDLGSMSWVQRGKLDGIASAGMLCEQLAPSMRVLRLLGAYRTLDESRLVREKLRDTFDEEFRRSGFEDLGLSALGAAILFSRVPVRTIAEIRRVRVWVWDIDLLGRQYAESVGLNALRLPIAEVKQALDENKLDAVFSVPAAALAYQWLPRLRYFIDVPLAFVTACFVVDVHVWERLQPDQQRAIRSAAASLSTRLEQIDQRDNQAVLDKARQSGMEEIVPPESVKAEIFEAYLHARERLGDQMVSPELVRRAIALLSAYRAAKKSPPPAIAGTPRPPREGKPTK